MKIALIGYGKMGRMIEEIALSRGHEIVSIIDIDNQQDFESQAFRSADVAIEFTAPHVAYDNYLKAFRQGVKVVSGSTGWLKEHGEDVKRMCTEEGRTLFWSSNFSLGVTVFRAVNRYLARIMNRFPSYTPQMEEVHHIHKLDHPSGTAITLAETVIANTPSLSGWTENTDTQGDNLVITHERRGEVPGIHTVRWDSPADSIMIEHSAKSREGFALGAVMAAEWLATRRGVHTIDEMIDELIKNT